MQRLEVSAAVLPL